MGNTSSALKKQKFLEAYAKLGNVAEACRELGLPRRTIYFWQGRDRAFKKAYDDAQEEAVEALEFEARKRAKDGWLEPVFFGGKPIGGVRKYSDLLLIFLLKAARPEKYRDSYEGGGGNKPNASREDLLASINGKLARLARPSDPGQVPQGDDGRGAGGAQP